MKLIAPKNSHKYWLLKYKTKKYKTRRKIKIIKLY